MEAGHLVRKIAIPEIDGLRGVAICAVIFHHLFSKPLTALNLRWFGIPLNPVLGNGALEVELFFMLSGFVLYLPYAMGTRVLATPGDWRQFYKRRTLRLLPAYYLATIAMMSLSGRQPFGSRLDGLQTFGLLTFTFPFIASINPTSVNWVLWSIGAEVLFSAVFPLLCLGCLRYGAPRVLVIYIPICMAIRFLAHFVPGYSSSWISSELMIGRIDEFLWGFVLAEFFAKKRLPKCPHASLAGATVVLALTLWVWTRAGLGLMPIGTDAWLVTTLDIGFALAIAAALSARSLFSDALTLRPLRVLGMACYSLYLWHFPILISLRLHIYPFDVKNLIAFVIFLLSLSAISYRFVEFRAVADWRSLFLLERRAPIPREVQILVGSSRS